MSEYRRFIAYFYEYIDGRRQKSAGFAKVELRGGIWRILLRLTAAGELQLPANLYGFVRRDGFLLGLPMGLMRTGQETAQEWAYEANKPVKDSCFVEDLAGLLVKSSDGRSFLTVWDEEEADLSKFVLELPKKAGEPENETAPEMQPGTQGETETALQTRPDTRNETQTQSEMQNEMAELQSESGGLPDGTQGMGSEADGGQEEIWEEKQENTGQIQDGNTEGNPADNIEDGTENTAKDNTQDRMEDNRVGTAEAERRRPGVTMMSETGPEKSGTEKPPDRELQELFGSRPRFKPFRDGEAANCVMLRPCDIVWLQQKGWQVGRSSFLQHGFQQYRHLLLCAAPDHSFTLGVPGLYNPQEKYMAGMFGFEEFRESGFQRGNGTFGYWCRALERRLP